ncbi:unnamed protein product [Durusdinium trenchii]|uniref:Uncharacterized protein n=1 Tax=Durusdinium trenchii TaxID=1381693 RepID=A0ABP0RMX3_9DINO
MNISVASIVGEVCFLPLYSPGVLINLRPLHPANLSNLTQPRSDVPSAVRGLRGSQVTKSTESRPRSFGRARGRWPGAQGWNGGNDWGWGHGVVGETCCMCSRRGNWGETILFAGGDYDHYYGSRSAHQQCDQVCELQCALQYGHKFGCYEEDDLRRFSQRYSGQANFVIQHKKWYGNIC